MSSISIHAPREGSDARQRRSARRYRYFYPRSPRGERRYCGAEPEAACRISIHAPREGSDRIIRTTCGEDAISIHAPREGSDPLRRERGVSGRHFYPRSPRGERRHVPSNHSKSFSISIHAPREGSDLPRRPLRLHPGISIHAPREGSDRFPAAQNAHPDHFYPRSPRGERPSC